MGDRGVLEGGPLGLRFDGRTLLIPTPDSSFFIRHSTLSPSVRSSFR